jgi:predicted metalloprotease
MAAYLGCIVPHVEQWIDAVYREMPHPSAYWFVPEGAESEDSAGCTYDSGALKYCFDHETIYMGEAAVWEQYTTYGDAASVVVLAHEVTHHFQNMSDMPRATVPNEQVRYENQADCGAGAFIAWAEAQGFLDRNDDIADLAGSLMAAGASEGPGQDHGTIEQRLGWFDAAYLSDYDQPLFACNELVSEVALIA